MLQVARLAPKLLGDSTDLVTGFFRSQLNPDGGFQDRAGNSDLYYSVFGLEGLLALRADLPIVATHRYLKSFGDGADLDFVHLACLARCWAALPVPLRYEVPADAIIRRVESFRSADFVQDSIQTRTAREHTESITKRALLILRCHYCHLSQLAVWRTWCSECVLTRRSSVPPDLLVRL